MEQEETVGTEISKSLFSLVASVRWHWGLLCVACLAIALPVSGATLILKDGRKLEGRFAECAGVADDPLAPQSPKGEVAVTPLFVVDDGLRRTYIHNTQVKQALEESTDRSVRIRIWQDVAETGGGIGRIGRALRVTPFDEYGRRIFEMQGKDGAIPVVQGITEITPTYAKVEGLAGPKPIVWDQRIATSSIPRDVLDKILTTAVPRDNANARLEVVRLYLDSERYRDAQLELEQVVHDFPDMKELSDEAAELHQLGARLALKEIQLRAEVGQVQLARALLSKFPSDGVAGETLQHVRELLANYDTGDQQRKDLLARVNAQVALVKDDNSRHMAEDFAKEIASDADSEALGRLSSFDRLADAADLSAEQKVALAISGWLVGANEATDDFHMAVSLAEARDKVRKYLREPTAIERQKLLAELRDTEGASVKRIAQILKLMKPPLDVPKEAKKGPGLFELTISGLGGGSDVRYVVQLPPEYDPLRHYPAVVVLADAGVPLEAEIDFWAGERRDEGEPLGQATRHGYITLAIDWLAPHQTEYSYSPQEHYAVLGSLRDACRRFSIDTDRVYLTGHGAGGNAAWDLALAHPDVWAGCIPFLALADRFVTRYSANAGYLPWYFIGGELDGDKMSQNSREYDRYLRPTADATVVEFQGRGYEPFNDELQRLFDWMGRRHREGAKNFKCATMRPWDNFFWWLEVNGMPEKSMVAPANWPPPRAARPFQVRGEVATGNKLQIFEQAAQTTVWLGPELINFDQPLTIELNGRRITPLNRAATPDLTVLLEDTRARGDRLHPFWAKVVAKGEGGRGKGEAEE
jgi:pimeloyl-ACP methyl ester carboxylesterase